MSLETEIQNLVLAIQANTAAMHGSNLNIPIAVPPEAPKPKAEKAKAGNKPQGIIAGTHFKDADLTTIPQGIASALVSPMQATADKDAFLEGDVLDEAPPEPVAEELEEETAEPLTLDDVRPLLLKIANHKALGNSQAFTLLKRHGAAKLTELKAENFEAIRDDAVLMLKKAGVAVR